MAPVVFRPGSFNSQPPTKGTAINNCDITGIVISVSILSPQQRGLQCFIFLKPVCYTLFQFSAPNKGDCNFVPDRSEAVVRIVSILSPQQRGLQSVIFSIVGISVSCFNSQPPTKGTAIGEEAKNAINNIVSILSPQQRGLQ